MLNSACYYSASVVTRRRYSDKTCYNLSEALTLYLFDADTTQPKINIAKTKLRKIYVVEFEEMTFYE